VAADLEHGFGDSPSAAAKRSRWRLESAWWWLHRRRRADREKPIYDLMLATERVTAAVQAARSLPFPFTLRRGRRICARQSKLGGHHQALVAYETPARMCCLAGLPICVGARRVLAVSKPVNFASALAADRSVCRTVDAGVKRISFAASFYRAAMTDWQTPRRKCETGGRSVSLTRAMLTAELNRYFPD